ncbi:MAG: hypothetical protein ABIG96_01845 [Candidatus Micrarchaeota archaeon]
MGSTLIITSVEALQKEINQLLSNRKEEWGIYLSLNKSQKSAAEAFSKAGIGTDRLFFIDCVATQQARRDVLHFKPTELEQVEYAVKMYIDEIPGRKFVLVDALSTLLIYNDVNKVAKFVKEVTEFADGKDVSVFAFTPKTQGEELLQKIYNFFDEVKGKK